MVHLLVSLWIELQEPQVVHGILGSKRKVAFVGLGLDHPEGFRRLVEERTSSAS